MKSSTSFRIGLKGTLLLSFFSLFFLHNIIGRKHAWNQTVGLAAQNQRRRLAERGSTSYYNSSSGISVDVDSLLSQAVTVRGFTRKSGPTKLQYWTAGNRTERHEAFEEWIKETTLLKNSQEVIEQENEIFLPELPPMYPNCQVLVNHRYKFIYIRHPKSASSSVMMYFTTCPVATPAPPGAGSGKTRGRSILQEGGEVEREVEGTTVSGTMTNLPYAARTTDGHGAAALGLGAACLEPLVISELSTEEVARMWQDYFVFTVVRNPYQRMLSSYKYLLRKTRASCNAVRWDAFCADPLSMGRMCQTYSECCPLPAGFYWHHVIDQARCLETEDGGWATDYVAAVEHFQEHMEEIIAEIDRRRSPELPPLQRVTAPLTHQNEARGTGAATACTESSDLADLKPEKTKVLSPTRGWVSYNAPVLQDRHCNAADYFRREHWRCLLQAQHFYATDIRRLYTAPATNITLAGDQQQEREAAGVAQ